MRFSVAAAALFSVVAVNAKDIIVKVGANSSLIFDPTDIVAAAGDTISFQFQGKNHSVTQSTFAAPCTHMTTPTVGVDSGFMSVAAGATSLPQWTISVNTTDPLWFYCAQTTPLSHCGMGMVFAVNAPPAKTFAQFQAAAKNTTTASASGSSAPPAKTGSGTSGSGSGSGSGSAPASSSTAKSSALKLGGSAAGVLTAAALFVGLVL